MQLGAAKQAAGKGVRFAIKALLSVWLLYMIMQSLFIDGLRPYQSYKDYNYQNNFNPDIVTPVAQTRINQVFMAKGNLLNYIAVYIGEGDDQDIKIEIVGPDNKVIAETQVNTANWKSKEWNRVGLSCDGLKRDQIYTISFISETPLNRLVLNSDNVPEIFNYCYCEDGVQNGALAIGLQFTYTYFTLGSIFEIIVLIFFSVIQGLALCYAVFNFEKLWYVFRNTEKKAGLSCAIFFAAMTTMLFNPMDPIRNQMQEFGRVMGHAVVGNIDVAKRTSNFNTWFLLFALTFIGFYLLFNALHQREMNKEDKKALEFLDNFMVIANCGVILRCISYFQDESAYAAVFHFSEYIMLLVAFVTIAYILLKISDYMSSNYFAAACMVLASLSYPIMVIIAMEWSEGRVLLGILFLFSIGFLFLAKIGGKEITRNRVFGRAIYIGACIVPFAPLATSLFIELIHVLNQWGVFIAHPATAYVGFIVFGLAVWALVTALCLNRKLTLPAWKSIAFPVFIIGAACLANQISLVMTFNPDIFEGANAGILISDFLNFGAIPNVEHYGGHMMTGVWEGILYGIVNRDFENAFVTPYASMITPFLCVLFYYFVKHIWDEDMAFFTALLFPFYWSSWNYYGLGMLACLAVVSYIKKHTYLRAALVWAALIWCALYRLDLGFAFIIATVVSMGIYCWSAKDKVAVKQLSLTLLAWGTIGTTAWCILCVIKGINPITRLIEFLMVNLSNQNWALIGIGDMTLTRFSWGYIVIPFMMVISLLYTVFSENFRDRVGTAKWVLLLILGCSFFANFSRGLVRHSLIENTLSFMWTGYLFLAAVFSLHKGSSKAFLPVFLVLILCNNLFLTDSIFAEQPVLNSAVSRPASIVESWKPGRFSKENGTEKTYWEKLSEDGEVVNRVVLNEELQEYAAKYNVLNDLLEEGETFADFINKTLLYCIMNRECPTYISQSPLQLSGEFMQEEFIKQIDGVPIVLVPANKDDNLSCQLDGIMNVYRYYKVSEYIYQNYVPLYKHGEDYTIWCLPERYEEYKEKLSESAIANEYVGEILKTDKVITNSAMLYEENGTLVIACTGIDPVVMDLQNVINIKPFVGKEMILSIEYETDAAGKMQLFYTTEDGEEYSEQKSLKVDISGNGKAEMTIPITEYTRIRLDTPEKSTVKISSFRAGGYGEIVNYGYDGPFETKNGDGSVFYRYSGPNHQHSLNLLARIWAECDEKESVDNRILQNLTSQNGTYVFDNTQVDKSSGNYLKIAATYDGNDTNGLFENDDEYINGTVVFGEYKDGQFKEKYYYNLTFMEGQHAYMIRCSTDYYWYHGNVNAVQFRMNGELRDVEMSILEGD